MRIKPTKRTEINYDAIIEAGYRVDWGVFLGFLANLVFGI